jgi:RimJ/RimL family protein N-acetyltransferase
MLKLLFSQDESFKEKLAKWVMARLFMIRTLRQGDFEVIAVARVDVENRKSEVIAGLLFHDYVQMGDGGKMEVSMVAEDPRWATRGIIRAILHYVFVQQTCHVLICTTNRTNKRTRRFLTGIGFEERGVIPNRPYADDTVIYSLRRETAQARWLEQEKRIAA